MQRVKTFGLSLVVLLIAAALDAQETDRLLVKRIASPVTPDSITFAVSLPASYPNGSESYPVVYFLHGMFGNYADGKCQWIADFFHAQAARENIPEVIVVCPDGGDGFWGDHYDGDPSLETDLLEGLIPYIDQSYRSKKSQRLILGWSAGGPGAALFGTKYPDVFKGIVSLDGAILTWEEILVFHPDMANQITGSDSAYYYEHFSPHTWAVRNRKELSQKKDTSIFLAASFFVANHARFLSLLEEQGIAVKYVAVNCDHDFVCVMSEVQEELLVFLSQLFKP